MKQERIYFDNNATTKVAPEVREAMLPFLSDLYGNPSSLHRFGAEIRVHIAEAYERLYALIDAADEDSIVVNSCGTEGNNTVLQGVYYSLIRNGAKRRIITTNVEHPATMNCLRFLETLGVEAIYLPINTDGFVTVEQVQKALTPDTALVSVMWANNETGVIFPVEDIAAICRSRGVLFHTDSTQAMGKIPVSVKSRNIDFLSYSGHKFHAPKGVGALYIRSGVSLPPLLHGGEQMGGLRGGTQNMPGIAALGMAAKLAKEGLTDELTRVRGLRDRFEDSILREIPDTLVNGKNAPRTPNTSSIIFKGIEGEALLWDLNENDIAASTGSACASGSEKASYVLAAMKIPAELAHCALRFSMSRYTTDREVDRVLEVLKKTVERLRKISTSYKKG